MSLAWPHILPFSLFHLLLHFSPPPSHTQALFSFTNSQGQAVSNPTEAVASFRLDYSKLYDTLTQTLGSASDNGQTTLLLYLLLHRNANVKEFLLSKTNVEQLVLPILKLLYTAQDQNSHHIYMALIILLVLSEDDFFNNSVHEIQLAAIPWYAERHLSQISLGGLLILVVVRTIQGWCVCVVGCVISNLYSKRYVNCFFIVK